MTDTATLRFFYNGIKGASGKLQKCHYSAGPFTNLPADTITIYARTYDRFSADVAALFAVENDSEILTDYHEKDRIRVRPDHPLYAAVKAAHAKQEARR